MLLNLLIHLITLPYKVTASSPQGTKDAAFLLVESIV